MFPCTHTTPNAFARKVSCERSGSATYVPDGMTWGVGCCAIFEASVSCIVMHSLLCGGHPRGPSSRLIYVITRCQGGSACTLYVITAAPGLNLLTGSGLRPQRPAAVA